MLKLTHSMIVFIAAGLCEIGGGYLIWLWLRKGHSVWLGVIGAGVLTLYGVLPTLQPKILAQKELGFGRVYAAYGAVFIALAMLWGWGVDKNKPDRWDLVGVLICLIGAAVILYWPRGVQ